VEVTTADVGLALLRLALGAVFLAHGWNHLLGGGRIEGTARWFASLGMRPPRLHAWLASCTELLAGALLVLGLATPAAGAAVVGTMLVAWVANHRGNGFFIFRPGEGWEYVMVLCLAGAAVAMTGPGRLSVDALLGWDEPGWVGAVAAVGGAVAAGALLAACWRPPPPAADG
jgi:putative oxidoreductase